mgnify:CR=1 FL=1
MLLSYLKQHRKIDTGASLFIDTLIKKLDFVLEKLPSGIFYMKVYFKPTNGKAKTGVYKIIKL